MASLIESVIRLDDHIAGEGILEAETALVNRRRYKVGINGTDEQLADLVKIVDVNWGEEICREAILEEHGRSFALRTVLFDVGQKRRV